MVLMLPVPATPTTNVAKMSGAMIDLIRRRKMVPSRPNSLAGPGNAAPNAVPATSPIRIQRVSEWRFTVHPSSFYSSPLPPFEFFAQHVEKHHVGRAHQADAVF